MMVHFKLLQYFADRGYLKAGVRMMDVGTQNLMLAEEAAATQFVRGLRRALLSVADTATSITIRSFILTWRSPIITTSSKHQLRGKLSGDGRPVSHHRGRSPGRGSRAGKDTEGTI
jgi:hypothetical protein